MKYILFKDNFGVYNYQTPYRIIYTDSINVKDIYINIIQKYNINNNNEITQSCDRETTLENLKTDLSYSIVPVTRDHSKDYAIARANIFNVIQKLHEVESDSYSIGGYIDNPDVLSQDGDCVILASAICKEGTYIKDSAIIGEAMIRGNVTISDNSIIFLTNIFSENRNNININGNAVIISSQLRLSSPQCNTLNIGDNVYIRGCNITGGADDHPTSIFISGYSYLHGIDIFNRFEPTAHTIKLHNTILENHCKDIRISIYFQQSVNLTGLTFALYESNKQKYLERFQDYYCIEDDENETIIACEVLSSNTTYYVRLDDFINYF